MGEEVVEVWRDRRRYGVVVLKREWTREVEQGCRAAPRIHLSLRSSLKGEQSAWCFVFSSHIKLPVWRPVWRRWGVGCYQDWGLYQTVWCRRGRLRQGVIIMTGHGIEVWQRRDFKEVKGVKDIDRCRTNSGRPWRSWRLAGVGEVESGSWKIGDNCGEWGVWNWAQREHTGPAKTKTSWEFVGEGRRGQGPWKRGGQWPDPVCMGKNITVGTVVSKNSEGNCIAESDNLGAESSGDVGQWPGHLDECSRWAAGGAGQWHELQSRGVLGKKVG